MKKENFLALKTINLVRRSDMKEKHLVKKIQAGDQHALDELISKLYPQIYSYVYVRVKGNECSKDITQEVFLNFIKNIDRFEFIGKTKHYLLRMAVNGCHNWYRTHPIQENDDKLENIGIEPLHPQRDLKSLLATLPMQQQEVLVLRYYEELKIKEIADILGISENTVKTRIRLGLEKLRKITKKEDWL
jgi:RNA polymerase sigma factor (sigma-70 family)